MKKYSLITDSKIEFLGRTLYRIKADVDFGNVQAGELGGYIEKEGNLSHYDNAWVYGDARVYGKAKVYGNARVYDNAWVYGDAKVYDNAWVCGDAWVYGNAKVYGNARVYDNAEVCDNAEVYGKAKVYDNAEVCDNAEVYGKAKVYGNAEVCDKMIVTNEIINLIGLEWNITLSSNSLLKIGCQLHTIEEWSSFTDDDISTMASKALTFWKKYRDIILGLSR